jgi:hypothetical protein
MKASTLTVAAQDILKQGLSLLSECDADTYARIAPQPFSASIGQHFRHVLDHFLCLASAIGTGLLNYDHRSRNRLIETNLEYARSHTQMLIWLFGTLTESECSEACTVECSVDYSDGEAQVTVSTLGRELAYCISHAVHHYAIMKLICAQVDVAVADEFGVAPSTLKFRAAQNMN